MTAPIRDVLASFDTSLDERRQDRALHAINGRLDAVATATSATSAAIVVPAAVGAVVVGVLVLFQVLRGTPATSVAVPSIVSVVSSAEPVVIRERASVQIARGTPEREAKAPVRAVAPATVERSTLSANELYRRAEAALLVRDRASARDTLQQLLAEFPTSGLVDAARYDLARLAVGEGDAKRAILHLDDVIATGRDPNIVAAARRLRGTVTGE